MPANTTVTFTMRVRVKSVFTPVTTTNPRFLVYSLQISGRYNINTEGNTTNQRYLSSLKGKPLINVLFEGIKTAFLVDKPNTISDITPMVPN